VKGRGGWGGERKARRSFGVGVGIRGGGWLRLISWWTKSSRVAVASGALEANRSTIAFRLSHFCAAAASTGLGPHLSK